MKNKTNKLILLTLLVLFIIPNSFSSNFFDVSCWLNEDPNFRTDFYKFDENGNFVSISSLDNTDIHQTSIDEGQIIGIDFQRTTDNENNIRNEKIVWMNDYDSSLRIDVQDNINYNQTISNIGFTFYKENLNFLNIQTFDSKKYHLLPFNKLMSYNDGNPQNDLFKVFKPEVGDYRIFIGVEDSCGDTVGNDYEYKFIDLIVNPTTSQNQTNQTNQTQLQNQSNTDSSDIGFDDEFDKNTYGVNENNNQNITINDNAVCGDLSDYEKSDVKLSNSCKRIDIYNNQNIVYVKQNDFNTYDSGTISLYGSNLNFQYDRVISGLNYFRIKSLTNSYIDIYPSNFYSNNLISSDKMFNSQLDLNGHPISTNGNMNRNILNDVVEIEIVDYLNNQNKFYQNYFYFTNIENVSQQYGVSSTGNGDIELYKEIENIKVGNAYIDENGNDIFECNYPYKQLTIDGVNTYVCSQPINVNVNNNSNQILDYIIISEPSGNFTTGQNDTVVIEENIKPQAILEVDNISVEVGQDICWDTTNSQDSDGSIVKKNVYIDTEKQDLSDSDCFTKNEPTTSSILLKVEDDKGLKSNDVKEVVFKKSQSSCEFNNPPSMVLSSNNIGGNIYELNITSNDLDNDTLSYLWSVNGETIKDKNITTPIDYTQTITASAYDGCDLTVESLNINTGKNQSEPINQINANLICSLDNIFTPSDLTCEVLYDLKGSDLESITWTMNNEIYNNFENNETFTQLISDTKSHLVSVTVEATNGEIKSDYYRFNLVQQNNNGGSSGGGGFSGGGGGDTPPNTKSQCDISVFPKTININSEDELNSLIISNNDDVSYSPDYNFEDIENENSVSRYIGITNEIGTIQASQSREIGITFSRSIFSRNSIESKNIMRLTSNNCNDIEIPINTNISVEEEFETFNQSTIMEQLSPGEFLETPLVESELIEDNEFIENLKVWQLVLVILILSTLILWNWKPIKSKKNDRTITNIIIKTLVISLVSIFISVIVYRLLTYIITTL